jgi:lipopolysaccharide export system permease protein
MSAENELLAMRTGGLSYLRICLPVLIVAGLLSLFCLWINVEVAPRAQERMQNSILSVATDNPVALFGSEQVIDQFPNKKIYVGRREGNKLYNLHVFELNERSQPIRVISAKEGTLTADHAQRAMIMRLKDATFEQYDAEDPTDLDKMRHGIRMNEVPIVVSLEELYQKNQARRTLTVMSVKELMNQVDNKNKNRGTKALTEFHKRFSFSLACLTLAVVGIPLGITTQRRETSAGFGVSLLVAFGYFMFIEVANSLRDNALARPHLIMWLPNILGLALGIWLFSRLAKR